MQPQVMCKVCGKVIDNKKHKLCSDKCRATYASHSRIKNEGKILTSSVCKLRYFHCEKCGKIFVVRPTEFERRFCSKQCRHDFGFPDKRVGKPLTTCQTCGKVFRPKNRRCKNNPQRFCSQSCGTKHRNLIHGNNVNRPEVREKISNTMKKNWPNLNPEWKDKFIKSGRVPVGNRHPQFLAQWVQKSENQERMSLYWKNRLQEHPEECIMLKLRRNHMTKIERETEAVLNMLCIKSKWNSFMQLKDGFCFPDFRILDTDIVVECNGDHWHNPIETAQRKQRYLDNGYYAIMLSESCIKAGTKSIVQALLDSPLKEQIDLKKL